MAKKLSGDVNYDRSIYDFGGPMFNLYGTPLDETAAEKKTRLHNRKITMEDASFKPDYPTADDPYRNLNYMAIADTASALGLPMPTPIGGPKSMYGQQQAADFVAANPVPNRMGVQALSPQDALVMRMRQMQAARAIPGSAAILSPRGFIPDTQDSTFAGGRDYANPQGPPASNNAIRDLIYQYMFGR